MIKKGDNARTGNLILGLFLILLVLYPLRRIYLGVDLWDGGYNYTNFRYSGPEYMDSMWYFATWIATRAGALLMRLPFSGTMLGMNLYTGLTVSLLAALSFVFCVRLLKLPAWLVFLGELTACGLCWLPTAALYNYLTFLLLTAGVILLYLGLTEGRERYLVAAGALLGLNVGVRFSNLVQTGLIVAVWAYCLLKKEKPKEILRKTLVCVAGYLAALGLFLLLMCAIYGFGDYFKGIARLFAMTGLADDYAPTGMLTSAFRVYFGRENLYWIKRFGAVLAVGTGICLIAPAKARQIKRILCVGMTGGLFCWLLTHRFVYPDFTYYDAIYAPCVMLLLLSVAVSLLFLIKRNVSDEDRLLAVLEILLILLTSLGGNNVIYYNINNMFLTLPILTRLLWRLWEDREDMLRYMLKTVVSALALLVCVLSLRFGNTFSYEEADGGRQMNYTITEIPVLRGMRTSAAKAEQLERLYRFLRDHCSLRDQGPGGRRCVLYGGIPGISYYMELPPALNVWADLRSYTPDVMRADLDALRKALDNGDPAPLIIMDASWADYMERPGDEAPTWDVTALQKLELLRDFSAEYHYSRTYESEKYVVYEKNGTKK